MSDSENDEVHEEQEEVEQVLDEEEDNREHDDEVEENHQAVAESDEEEFAGFGEEEINKQTKKAAKRKVLSDDEDGDQEHGEEAENEEVEEQEEIEGAEEQEIEEEVEEEAVEGEEEAVEHHEEVNEDAELSQHEEHVEEENEEQIEEAKPSKKKKKGGEQKSDLEEAIEKSKTKKKGRRKNDDSEALTNIDNTIALLVTEMKNAAAEDRAANEKRICSIKKLKMLEVVTNMLQRSEHYSTMIELGMLGAIAEWLAPLPDRSLPNIKIRELLIHTLQDFGEIDVDYLKSSGIGKAAMFLYKHPKETKPNKEKLEKLIHNWSRPIFNLDSNYKQLSKEERQQRDMEHVKSLHRRASQEDNMNTLDIDNVLGEKYTSKSKKQKTKDGEDILNAKPLRPGDPGFCPRARVPLPSNKDYVFRPKSNLDSLDNQSMEKKSKKSESRLDKHKKRFIEMKKQSKTSKAVLMSIEGRKLPL